MSVTIQQLKNTLTGMNRGASLDDVVNLYELFERVGNTLLGYSDPIETIRNQQLSQFVHDDLQKYSLPSDYKKVIDIANVEDRQASDRAFRVPSESFSAELNIRNKQITVEANEGVKFININWKDRCARTLHTMDSLTSNGTISAVGTATGLKANSQYKLSGSASIEFDVVASDDGIQNTTMTALDLTDEDEMADFIIPVYLGSVTNLTSLTFIFGNDLTANYWTTVAQTTQADGTAFRVGWNFILCPWATATKTGTVTATTIDSFKLTVQATGAISNIRVDNILVSMGRPFDLKYYSQYIFKNLAGTWISIPTVDTDSCVLSGVILQAYILECLIAINQQLRTNPADYNYAKIELKNLYAQNRSEFPSMSKRMVETYWNIRPFRR